MKLETYKNWNNEWIITVDDQFGLNVTADILEKNGILTKRQFNKIVKDNKGCILVDKSYRFKINRYVFLNEEYAKNAIAELQPYLLAFKLQGNAK